MTRIRTVLVACALALPIPAAIAGCGGSDSSSSGEDPQTVLDETFNNDTKVTSGDLTLSASVDAEGSQGGQFQASLSGPFQGDASNPNTLPQLNWTANVSGSGAGQSIDFAGGLTITDDNAYVTYKDQAYEVGTKEFAQIKSQVEQAGTTDAATASFAEGCKQAIEQAGGDPSACDIDFESWLTNLTNEGDADVGGTPTTHISGDADVTTILSDIGNIASSIPSAASSGFDPSQLSLASGAIKDASIDVYSGTDDHVLRKLDVNLTVDPSALGAPSDQIGQITISFSVEIDGLNEAQTITAPENAKPIAELLQSSGLDLGALGGSLGGASGSGSSGGGASSDYLDCIQQAQTADQINQCAAQL